MAKEPEFYTSDFAHNLSKHLENTSLRDLVYDLKYMEVILALRKVYTEYYAKVSTKKIVYPIAVDTGKKRKKNNLRFIYRSALDFDKSILEDCCGDPKIPMEVGTTEDGGLYIHFGVSD